MMVIVEQKEVLMDKVGFGGALQKAPTLAQ